MPTARRGLDEAGDHAQDGRFAAAGRTDDADEFVVAQHEIDVRDGMSHLVGVYTGKALGNICKLECQCISHGQRLRSASAAYAA